MGEWGNRGAGGLGVQGAGCQRGTGFKLSLNGWSAWQHIQSNSHHVLSPSRSKRVMMKFCKIKLKNILTSASLRTKLIPLNAARNGWELSEWCSIFKRSIASVRLIGLTFWEHAACLRSPLHFVIGRHTIDWGLSPCKYVLIHKLKITICKLKITTRSSKLKLEAQNYDSKLGITISSTHIETKPQLRDALTTSGTELQSNPNAEEPVAISANNRLAL